MQNYRNVCLEVTVIIMLVLFVSRSEKKPYNPPQNDAKVCVMLVVFSISIHLYFPDDGGLWQQSQGSSCILELSVARTTEIGY